MSGKRRAISVHARKVLFRSSMARGQQLVDYRDDWPAF